MWPWPPEKVLFESRLEGDTVFTCVIWGSHLDAGFLAYLREYLLNGFQMTSLRSLEECQRTQLINTLVDGWGRFGEGL